MSNSFAGFGTQRPNLTGDPELSDDERTVGRWFNTGAFTLAPQFTARVEVFNLTNAPPLGAPNGTFGSAAFGTITTAGDPRVIRLALKYIF